MNDEQYKLVCARRNTTNQILWQVPTLASAGQGFLLATAFNPSVAQAISGVAAVFSLVLGLAALQLMAKHRYFEMRDSESLFCFEKANIDKGYSVLHGPTQPMDGIKSNWFVRISSFRLWIVILSGFCLLALFAIYRVIARVNALMA
ncbi:MAG: hypothetical protein ACLPIX_05090 [Rhodomicrobium sp.]